MIITSNEFDCEYAILAECSKNICIHIFDTIDELLDFDTNELWWKYSRDWIIFHKASIKFNTIEGISNIVINGLRVYYNTGGTEIIPPEKMHEYNPKCIGVKNYRNWLHKFCVNFFGRNPSSNAEMPIGNHYDFYLKSGLRLMRDYDMSIEKQFINKRFIIKAGDYASDEC